MYKQFGDKELYKAIGISKTLFLIITNLSQ